MITGAGVRFCSFGDISAHRDQPPEVDPTTWPKCCNRHFNPFLLRLLGLRDTCRERGERRRRRSCPLALAGDILVGGAIGSVRMRLRADPA